MLAVEVTVVDEAKKKLKHCGTDVVTLIIREERY